MLLALAMLRHLSPMLVAISILVFLPVALGGASSGIHGFAEEKEIPVWPKPHSLLASGSGSLALAENFTLRSSPDSIATLSSAFARYREIIFLHHSIFLASRQIPESIPQLQALSVRISSPDETLQIGVDESYRLQIPDPDDATAALLTAETVYGALHGLETFSQICAFNFTTKMTEVRYIPVDIVDRPRFEYRGLLIDTSRHYEPLKIVRSVIDSMAYAKLNVLHWHIVDTQSFPLEIPSFPKLWNGAYTGAERYTLEDAKGIVEYARLRGINVMPELDVPGHAASWGVGYPELWPSGNCTQPLDVSSEFTFEVIEGIISDFAKTFPFKFMHLGGDEVDTTCWKKTRHIARWLAHNNFTAKQGYEYFVLRAQKIALKYGLTPVNWEETFNNFGSKLNNETIIHNWIGPGLAPLVVGAGFKCIVSDQDVWYLDHLDVPWQSFYKNEPLTNITGEHEQSLIIGGEVCMWGETVDPSDIHQTIWPRAAAAAERLWSPRSFTDQGTSQVHSRLKTFRCLLQQRGIPAAPVDELGRVSPPYPGSCYDQ
ncbi:beta-hexosaminidase 3 isoform X2 [Selaginella moellendorffii]|uniref:beta-hexosaminidase 3 isoform X1 n=1 Tax=Selaginella moellendorffii TaxID=88036 RepID=UPI000D1C8F3E|nr:beta-hexosaminidase 3 isoform X1 [Selaginella moellendorffii]XP_024542690.1 beta-hexosaminidase 3 isoform X2 [Selaginella moellendorffii]|eukprot:XP_024542689.1 beta-hexosaminidase 3 isoform X1 [Selaginella moellendorffii]